MGSGSKDYACQYCNQHVEFSEHMAHERECVSGLKQQLHALKLEVESLDAANKDLVADNAAILSAIKQAWDRINTARVGIPPKIWESIQPIFSLLEQRCPGDPPTAHP